MSDFKDAIKVLGTQIDGGVWAIVNTASFKTFFSGLLYKQVNLQEIQAQITKYFSSQEIVIN